MSRAISSPKKLFEDKQDWAAWLDQNHSESTGLWLQIAKKGSKLQSVTYLEAVEVALCYGWIDGQKRPEDRKAWLQKFLPCSGRSVWSQINREKAEALIASGEMTSAGLKAIEQAKKSGRWVRLMNRQVGRRFRAIYGLLWMQAPTLKLFSKFR